MASAISNTNDEISLIQPEESEHGEENNANNDGSDTQGR